MNKIGERKTAVETRNRFRMNCHRIKWLGKSCKAYLVPGTVEAARDEMLGIAIIDAHIRDAQAAAAFDES